MKSLLLVLGVLILIAGWTWFRAKEPKSPLVVNPEPIVVGEERSEDIVTDYSVRPDFSKVKDFKNTLQLQKGVSVKYGNGWVGKKTGDDEFVGGGLFKTIDGRSYTITLQENNGEYLSTDGAYAINLQDYSQVQINNKTHYIITSRSGYSGKAVDYAYVSSCLIQPNKGCSLMIMGGGYLFIQLRQDVPNAQYPVELDFSRQDDQQILAEFAEIMSTLQY